MYQDSLDSVAYSSCVFGFYRGNGCDGVDYLFSLRDIRHQDMVSSVSTKNNLTWNCQADKGKTGGVNISGKGVYTENPE